MPAVPLARLSAASPGRGPGHATASWRAAGVSGWRRARRRAATLAAGVASSLSSPVASSLSSTSRSSAFSPAGAASAAAFTATCSSRGRSPGCFPSRAAPGRSPRAALASGLRLVHPHHAVVVVGDRPEVARRPAVHEGVRVDARHAPLGHLRELEVREERQFGEENRIKIGILRSGAAVGVEQRQRFVQVVHDRRVRGEVPVGDRPHRLLREVYVSVVIVVDVLPPIGHRGAATATATSASASAGLSRRRFAACSGRRRGRAAAGRVLLFLRAVEPVDVAIAAVGIGLRRHRHDDVLANLTDER